MLGLEMKINKRKLYHLNGYIAIIINYCINIIDHKYIKWKTCLIFLQFKVTLYSSCLSLIQFDITTDKHIC